MGGRTVDILISEGRIVALGADLDADSASETVDLGDRLVVPGLGDAHVHFTQWAFHRLTEQLNHELGAARTAEKAADAIRQHTRGLTGSWIRGAGFRQSTWPEMPHKTVLDAAAPGIAVALTSQDGHSAWFSSAALAAIGLEHETGYLREWESWEGLAALPAPSPQETEQAIDAAIDAAVRRGVTRIRDFGKYADVQRWLQRSEGDTPLPFRVSSAVGQRELERAEEEDWKSGQTLDREGRLTVGTLKLFSDGALGSRTAHCDHSYFGEPENTGMPLLEFDELKELLRRATRQGLDISVHAIGDRANRTVLDAFEAVSATGRIEHAQLIAPSDRERFARLGITASVQPGHAVDDQDLVEQWWGDRTDIAYPLRSLASSGARLLFGSDAPVSPLDPWRAIAAAVHRTVDERPPWMAEETVGLEDALAASCETALAAGEPADLVVLDEDPTRLSATDLVNIRVAATMVGGAWTLPPQWG